MSNAYTPSSSRTSSSKSPVRAAASRLRVGTLTAALLLGSTTVLALPEDADQPINIRADSVEYDQSVVGGPPHSVPTEEVEQLFGNDFALTRRHRSDPAKPEHPRFVQAGLESWQESVWVLERSPGGPTGRIDA